MADKQVSSPSSALQPNTTESKSVVGVAFAFGLPAYDQLKSNPDVQCFDRKSQKLIPNIETFLKDNGGLFKEASNSGEVELIPLQSIVYAVVKVTAASSMNQCPLVAGWGRVTGGLELKERVAQAAAKAKAKPWLHLPGKSKLNLVVSGGGYKTGKFIDCGWSDAKTMKLQMETDKALRRQIAQFRFDVAKKLAQFSFFKG